MRLSKKFAAIAITATAALTASAAFAFWSTSGSGSGSASTTAGVSNQISFTQSTILPMYPGDASQVLTVGVQNNSADNSSAQVDHVTAYITTNKAGCTGSDFLLGGLAAPSTVATAAALTWTGANLAHGASANATSTIQFNDTASNQDVCKTALVTLNYLAS